MENRRILMAEDDPLARRSLSGILARHNYEVTAVEDGAAAWQVLQNDNPPPVILLDWMMPGLNGMDVMERIRQTPRIASSYVIFLTARQDPADISASLTSGAQDFVSKPFNEEELAARIQVAFRTVELQRQLAQRVAELELALKRITQLEGILPICAKCKKIRDASNDWKTVETYLQKHAPVSFTHGLCPECVAQMLKELE